jgi:hypothetical protein
MLKKSKSLAPNITRKESMELKYLKDKKKKRILQSNKGNCTVMLKEFTRNTDAFVKNSGKNSVALVRRRTIPTKRESLVGEVSAKFSG